VKLLCRRARIRDYQAYGIEVQFLDPVEIRFAHTFRQDMDPTRTPRAMAIAGAEELREDLQALTV
jgi:hypothetical protein